MKKFLSVALALAMTLSLVVVGASAKDFTDNSKVNHKEAVTVMNKLGIVSGYTDGSFKPEGNITRGAAAKIICYSALGSTTADALACDVAPFKDVSTKNVFAPYIAYCVNAKIVDGYTDGTFKPTASVSGYAFAKMLLTALKIEGTYTGANWSVNVAQAAMKAGLFSGIDSTVVYSKAATRDNACQMAFNALFFGKDESTTSVKYVVTESGVNHIYDTFAEAQAALATAGSSYQGTMTVTETITKGSLADTVFNLKKLTTATSDEFGRPSTTYQQKNSKGNYVDLAAFNDSPVATYTGAVSASELYNKLGYAAVIDGATSYYSVATNGTKKTSGYIKGDMNTATGDITVSAKTVALGGTGIVTEIYATSTTNHYIVIQVRPTLAKVTSVVKTAATSTTGAYTTYTINGVACKVFSSVVNASTDVDNVTIDGTIAKDSWVIITGNDDAGYTVTPAKLVTGKLTGYNSSADAYTIDGTAYVKSDAVAGTGVTSELTAFNTTATYALDTYGNVVGAVTVTVPTNYVFVLTAAKASYLNTTTNRVEDVAEATIITTDGKLSTIKVNAPTDASDLDGNTAGGQTKGLFSYTVTTDGKYTLTQVTTAVKDTLTPAMPVATVAKGSVVLNDADGLKLYADAATKFYVAQKNTSSVYTGVTSYVGYSNVPSMTVPGNAIALDSNGDGIADVVFMDASELTGVSASYVYVTGSYTSDGTTKTYDVVVNGAASKMALTDVAGAGLYKVTNGKATAVTDTAALDIVAGTDGKYTNTYFTYENGLLKTCATADGTYAVLAPVTAATPVYTLANGTCTATTAADLSAATGTQVIVAVNGAKDAISAIYIVK